MAHDRWRQAALQGEEQPGRAEPDDRAPERRAQEMQQGEQCQPDRAVLGIEAEEPEGLVEDPWARPHARSLAGLARGGGQWHHG
jgi:hypothetical protein